MTMDEPIVRENDRDRGRIGRCRVCMVASCLTVRFLIGHAWQPAAVSRPPACNIPQTRLATVPYRETSKAAAVGKSSQTGQAATGDNAPDGVGADRTTRICAKVSPPKWGKIARNALAAVLRTRLDRLADPLTSLVGQVLVAEYLILLDELASFLHAVVQMLQIVTKSGTQMAHPQVDAQLDSCPPGKRAVKRFRNQS